MPAYILAEHEVHHAEHYEKARPIAASAIEHFGGRYLVNGVGEVDLVEGAPAPKRIVVIEFPNMEAARAFHRSTEYRAGRDIRQQAATSRLLLAEGCTVD